MFFGVGGLTVLLSLMFGALAHAPLQRAIAVGFYLIGCLVLVFGFFVGNRGPLRHNRDLEDEEKPSLMGLIPRGVRRATPEERKEAVSVSFLFIILGLSFIVLGALSDSAHKLF
jgi:hypothetical protein